MNSLVFVLSIIVGMIAMLGYVFVAHTEDLVSTLEKSAPVTPQALRRAIQYTESLIRYTHAVMIDLSNPQMPSVAKVATAEFPFAIKTIDPVGTESTS